MSVQDLQIHRDAKPHTMAKSRYNITAYAEIQTRILWRDVGARFADPPGCQPEYYGAISVQHDYIHRNTNPNTMARFRYQIKRSGAAPEVVNFRKSRAGALLLQGGPGFVGQHCAQARAQFSSEMSTARRRERPGASTMINNNNL